LQNYCATDPQKIRARFSLAQLYLSAGDTAKALSTLEAANPDLINYPGVVATRVALYEKLNDAKGAMRTFEDSISWYEAQTNKDDNFEEAYVKILRASGEYLLKHKKFEQAVQIYEKLIKRNKNDLISLSALVVAASQFNLVLAEKYEALIPDTVAEKVSVDVDVLENMPAPRYSNKQNLGDDKPKKVVTENKENENKIANTTDNKLEKKEKKKKKKKKKTRLPKNYNPAVPPDPERWLPKWQRSYFKKKQKKKG